MKMDQQPLERFPTGHAREPTCGAAVPAARAGVAHTSIPAIDAIGHAPHNKAISATFRGRLAAGWLVVVTIVSLSLLGCSSVNKDPGVPGDASLVTEFVSPAGARSTVPAKQAVDQSGALYVVDASQKRNLFSGPVEPGEVILIYQSGVSIGKKLQTRGLGPSLYEQRVASFDANVLYRVYFRPGGKVEKPTPVNEGSPTTRVYETRQRKVDPTNSNPD